MYGPAETMCDVCGEGHETEHCPEMLDDKLAAAMETSRISRARLTLPPYLRVVDDPDGTIRVIAKEPIPRKTQFDPYEARKTTEDLTQAGVFALKVFLKEGGGSIHLDASSERECNWLCLVPTARTPDEVNCIVIQMRNYIYYMTSHDVSAEEELRVWYSPFYARKLGAPVEPDGITVTMLMYRPSDIITMTAASVTASDEIVNHSLQTAIDFPAGMELIQVTELPAITQQDDVIESLFCATCGEPCANQQLLEAHEQMHTSTDEAAAVSVSADWQLESPDSASLLDRLVKVRPPPITPGPDGMFRCPNGCEDILFESELELSHHIVKHVEMEIKQEEPAKKRGRPRKYPVPIVVDDDGSEKATVKRRGRPPKRHSRDKQSSESSGEKENVVAVDKSCDIAEAPTSDEGELSEVQELAAMPSNDVELGATSEKFSSQLVTADSEATPPNHMLPETSNIASSKAAVTLTSQIQGLEGSCVETAFCHTEVQRNVISAQETRSQEIPAARNSRGKQKFSESDVSSRNQDGSREMASRKSEPVIAPLEKSKIDKTPKSSVGKTEKANVTQKHLDTDLYETYTPTPRIPNLPTETIIRTRRAAKREIQLHGAPPMVNVKSGKTKVATSSQKTKTSVTDKAKDGLPARSKPQLISRAQKRKAKVAHEDHKNKIAKSDFEDKVLRSLVDITEPSADHACSKATDKAGDKLDSDASGSQRDQSGSETDDMSLCIKSIVIEGGNQVGNPSIAAGGDRCAERKGSVGAIGSAPIITITPTPSPVTLVPESSRQDATVASQNPVNVKNRSQRSTLSAVPTTSDQSQDMPSTVIVVSNGVPTFPGNQPIKEAHKSTSSIKNTTLLKSAVRKTKRFQCTVCSQSFADYAAFEAHQITHENRVDFADAVALQSVENTQMVHDDSEGDGSALEDMSLPLIQPQAVSTEITMEEDEPDEREEGVGEASLELNAAGNENVETNTEICEFRVLAASSTTKVVEDVAKTRNSRISADSAPTEATPACQASELGEISEDSSPPVTFDVEIEDGGVSSAAPEPEICLLPENSEPVVSCALANIAEMQAAANTPAVETDSRENSSEVSSTQDQGQNIEVDEGDVQLVEESSPVRNPPSEAVTAAVKTEPNEERQYKKSAHLQAVNRNCTVLVKEDGKYTYTCKHCEDVSANFEEFELHLEKSHPDLFQCEACGGKYSRYEHLEKHDCTVKVCELHVCKICSRAHESALALKKHELGHVRQFQCNACLKKFVREESLRKHVCLKPVEAGVLARCSICSATFATKKYLLRHMSSHTGQFSCEGCGKSFGRKESKLQHMRTCLPESMAEYFPCKLCTKVFTKEVSLLNHIKIHEERFKCPICYQVFTSKFSLDKHDPCPETQLPFEKTENGVKCMDCDKEFSSLKNLRRHQSIHTDKNKCDICGKTFSRKDECEQHVLGCQARQTIEAVGVTPCRACGETFSDPVLFQRHMATHNSVYHCPNCTKGFLRKHNFDQHMQEGTCKKWDGKTPLECDECNKHFATPPLLERHMVIHGEPRFHCESCNRKFVRSDHYNEHICLKGNNQRVSYNYLRTKKEKVKLICDECGKDFVSSSNLNKHKLTHKEKSLACPICGKLFHIKTGLKEHIKYVHSEENSIECSYCGTRMKCRNSLFGHIKQFHSGENTQFFKCEQCPRQFRQKGNLQKHLLTHSDEKTFQCKLPGCLRKFKFSEQLKKHTNWHEHGAQYSCDQCDKQFIMKHELDKHNRQNHMGIVYQCRLCNCDFKHQSTLKRHLERRHPDGTEWKENPTEFIRKCEQHRPPTVSSSEDGEQFVIYNEDQSSYFIVKNDEGDMGQFVEQDAQGQMRYIIVPGDEIAQGELQYDAAGNLLEVDVQLQDPPNLLGPFEQSQGQGSIFYIRNPDGSHQPVHIDTGSGELSIEVGSAVDGSNVDMELSTEDYESQLMSQPQVAKMAYTITLGDEQQTITHIPESESLPVVNISDATVSIPVNDIVDTVVPIPAAHIPDTAVSVAISDTGVAVPVNVPDTGVPMVDLPDSAEQIPVTDIPGGMVVSQMPDAEIQVPEVQIEELDVVTT